MLEQAVQIGAKRARIQRSARRRFQLAENLRLSQYHRIQSGGDAEDMADCTECGSVYRCGVNSLKGIWRQADSQRAAHCAYPASIEACMDDALPVSAAP